MSNVVLAALCAIVCLGVFVKPGSAQDRAKPEAAVAAVLDDWHKAASEADEKRYFGYMADESVFMGTDATERWTKKQFQDYAHPHFARGKAWSFKAARRAIAFTRDGKTAWFDEDLETPNLGPARGSGVLVKVGSTWKIVQYNLSVPIPNGVFDQVKMVIADGLKATSP